MAQDSWKSERILYKLLREWLNQQEDGSELLVDFEQDPAAAAPQLHVFLEQTSDSLPPTLATFVLGGRVEKLVNIAQAEVVHFHLTEVEPIPTIEEMQELENRYLERVTEECRYLETKGVDQVYAELTDVFVMLEAVESPGREVLIDIAPLPERTEEMALMERGASVLSGYFGAVVMILGSPSRTKILARAALLHKSRHGILRHNGWSEIGLCLVPRA